MPAYIDKNGKRRVPDALRRRTLISCDRCKTRRSRCLRSNENEPCTSCIAGGYTCESTIPRKQRVYGSVESLNQRYRTLEALVQGLFPDENTRDLATLLRLAKDRQISIPLSNERNASLLDLSPSNTTTPNPITNQRSSGVGGQRAAKSSSGEKLIPAPHGVPHYIGPASSFQFATAIRKLVARYNATVRKDLDQPDEHRLRADFADMKISIALEPRVHPTAAARNDSDEDDFPTHDDADPAGGLPLDTPSVTSPGSSVLTRSCHVSDMLPPRELADDLVQGFFERTHCNYVLFHHGTFQAQYESLWHDDQGPSDPGWTCCLLMIVAFGAQFMEGDSPKQAVRIQKRSLAIVRNMFHQIAFTASLSNVQALMLLQLFEYNAGERNTAWLHLGQATRMAMALGMHREGTNSIFKPIERNLRRIVWCTLYMFESSLSISLGRPSIINPEWVSTGLPEQHLMDGGDHPPDFWYHSLELTEISIRVGTFVSTVSTRLSDDDDLQSTCAEAQSLLQELQDWVNKLPQHLAPTFQSGLPRYRRATILMHIYCHHLRSVMTRSYLLHTVNWHIANLASEAQNSASPLPDLVCILSQECSQAAVTISDYLQQLAADDLLNGVTWLDFYYVYHNILVASLAVFREQLDPSAPRPSRSIHASCIQSMMQMCRQNRLAHTYQILLRVAFQFAHIVGIASENSLCPSESQELIAPSHDMPGLATQDFSDHMSNSFHTGEDTFMPFADTYGLYYGGNDGLDMDLFGFSGDMDFSQMHNHQLPPPAETFGEPGLMVYGNANPWRPS